MNKPVCYMLVGVPGSGKTTWAREQGLPVVSSDAWVERLAAERGLDYDDAFAQVYTEATTRFFQEIDQMVQDRRSFIWDQTNLGQGARAKKLRRLRGYAVVAEVWNVSQDELERRLAQRTDKRVPPEVMSEMHSMFSIPSPDEGFHQVVVHKE